MKNFFQMVVGPDFHFYHGDTRNGYYGRDPASEIAIDHDTDSISDFDEFLHFGDLDSASAVQV